MLKEQRIRALVNEMMDKATTWLAEFRIAPTVGKAWFDKSSDLFEGPSEFIDIYDEDPEDGEEMKVGEIEVGKIDNQSIEIVSIYVKSHARGIGRKVLSTLWEEYPGVDKIYLIAAPSSVGFWKKVGAVQANIPGKGKDYYVINKASVN